MADHKEQLKAEQLKTLKLKLVKPLPCTNDNYLGRGPRGPRITLNEHPTYVINGFVKIYFCNSQQWQIVTFSYSYDTYSHHGEPSFAEVFGLHIGVFMFHTVILYP